MSAPTVPGVGVPLREAHADRSTVARVVRLVRPRWAALALGVGASVLASANAVALLAAGAWLIARASQHPPIVALSVAVVAVRAFAVGRAVFRYVERLVTHDATLRVLGDLRISVWTRLERLAPAGLPAFRRGDLLGRLVSDVEGVQDLFLRALVPLTSAVLVGVGSAVFLVWLLPSVALAVLAAVVVLGALVPRLAAKASAAASRRAVDVRARLGDGVVDTFSRLPELRAYDAQEQRLRDLRGIDRDLTAALDTQARVRGAGAGAVALVGGLLVWLAVVLGVPALRGGSLSPVLLVVLVLLPLGLTEVLGALPGAAQELLSATAAARRVFEVLDTDDPVVEPTAPLALPEGPYDVQLQGLAARWTPGGPEVLAGLDLDLSPGRRVAVVGSSGSGKTTAAMVLLRFLTPSAGVVTINGVSSAHLDGDDVRRVVGLLAQDAHVFDSTIWENVRLARPTATRDDVRDALRRARLLDHVESLPDGLDTWVGEHGARLSGGERQRLALARALLADFPVLVLDEPAEHLDSDTGDALMADLLEVTRDRTTLVITHRLRGIEDLDEIVVLDGGRVIDRGRHDDLVARPGRYREAYLEERALDALVS